MISCIKFKRWCLFLVIFQGKNCRSKFTKMISRGALRSARDMHFASLLAGHWTRDPRLTLATQTWVRVPISQLVYHHPVCSTFPRVMWHSKNEFKDKILNRLRQWNVYFVTVGNRYNYRLHSTAHFITEYEESLWVRFHYTFLAMLMKLITILNQFFIITVLKGKKSMGILHTFSLLSILKTIY